MHLVVIQRVLGLLLLVFSATLLPPMAVGWWYGESLTAFVLAFAINVGLGMLLWLPVRKQRRELRTRDGFVVVVMFWVVLGLVGAIPLSLSDVPHMRFVDAAFESYSGLTTTGATVLTGLDTLPHVINYYRMQLHWLGGMGIIVLAVAILPMLGIGGMQLYRAETPGPMKDNKLTPRITETAKALWYIYLGLTVACAAAFWLAGMNTFDAVGHSFSVLSTGGFSTHDASLAFFDSRVINIIAIVFMVLAGANFALHFLAWRAASVRAYLADSEFKAYLLALVVLSLVVFGVLYASDIYAAPGDALVHSLFQIVSIGTSTGLVTASFGAWPGFLPLLILFASFVCGCAGSTAGGIKMIRALLLLKQGQREIMRLIHPSGKFVVKVDGKPLSDRVVEAVWGFFSVYVAVFVIALLVLMGTGLDQVTAFSAVVACINNMGVGLGDVSSNFAGLTDTAKWTLSLTMVMGRLEIFTLLVLLTPAFWRK